MQVIGIRANPNKIFYSLINISGETFSVSNEELIIPVSFDVPQKLKYVRKTMLDIFNEYNVEFAGIRIAEPAASAFGAHDSFRIMLEGNIQELIASSKVQKYFLGIKVSIASKLGLSNDGSISTLVEGGEKFKDIPGWSKISKEHRECILVAFATYNL